MRNENPAKRSEINVTGVERKGTTPLEICNGFDPSCSGEESRTCGEGGPGRRKREELGPWTERKRTHMGG